MAKIRVVIADDMQILRKGLRAILSQDEDIEVVATAGDGKEAFEKCKALKPDVVLMDMRMPDYDGAYGISAIKESLPQVKALVLTTFDDDETIEKAMKSGADGYILKEMDDDKITSAIKNVHEGIGVFGGSVLSYMRGQISAAGKAGNDGAAGGGDGDRGGSSSGGDNTPDTDLNLTDRERDIIRLVAQGYDNKEIAAELFLAEGTVRNLVSRLLEKTGLKDRTQLAVYAVKHGLD